jgi:transposase InsO family protein
MPLLEEESSRAEARRSIFGYLEVWYNRQRPHSTLGYCSPEAFEKRHLESNPMSSTSL